MKRQIILDGKKRLFKLAKANDSIDHVVNEMGFEVKLTEVAFSDVIIPKMVPDRLLTDSNAPFNVKTIDRMSYFSAEEIAKSEVNLIRLQKISCLKSEIASKRFYMAIESNDNKRKKMLNEVVGLMIDLKKIK